MHDAAAGAGEVGQEGFGEQYGGQDVRGEVAPVAVGDGLQAAVVAGGDIAARVGDQDVHRAGGGRDEVHRGTHLRWFAEISGRPGRRGLTVGGVERVGRLPQDLRAPPQQDDPVTVGREGPGCGQADSRPAAGHHYSSLSHAPPVLIRER